MFTKKSSWTRCYYIRLNLNQVLSTGISLITYEEERSYGALCLICRIEIKKD